MQSVARMLHSRLYAHEFDFWELLLPLRTRLNQKDRNQSTKRRQIIATSIECSLLAPEAQLFLKHFAHANTPTHAPDWLVNFIAFQVVTKLTRIFNRMSSSTSPLLGLGTWSNVIWVKLLIHYRYDTSSPN